MIDIFFDIGATNTRYSIKENKTYIAKDRYKTKDMELLSSIDSVCADYKEKIDFIGIAFAGQVLNNKIISSPGINIPNIDIADYLKEKYSTDVVIENDLKCAALAEYATRKTSKMLSALYIGSGIGSACIYQGKLIRGADNLAGEIGHIYFKESPFQCGCGKNSCVELFSSGGALEKWFKFYSIQEKATLDNLNKIDKLKDVKKNFYDGILLVCSVIVKMMNPDFIVLGGGVIKNNPHLAQFMINAIEEFDFLNNRIKTEVSTLNDAPLAGAEILKQGESLWNHRMR